MYKSFQRVALVVPLLATLAVALPSASASSRHTTRISGWPAFLPAQRVGAKTKGNVEVTSSSSTRRIVDVQRARVVPGRAVTWRTYQTVRSHTGATWQYTPLMTLTAPSAGTWLFR